MNKPRTNKNITFNALNSHYLSTEPKPNSINKMYLNDAISMNAEHTEDFYNMIVKNRRHKITAIVWSSFMNLTNKHIKDNEAPNNNFICNSQHLKDWLAKYKSKEDKSIYDVLKQATDYLTEMRNEALEEKKEG